MPRIGRDRKATPLAVWKAGEKVWGSFIRAFPKPKPSESFGAYLKRLDWREEALFVALIAVGCTKDGSPVNQRVYLMALEDMADALYRLRAALSEMWPK